MSWQKYPILATSIMAAILGTGCGQSTEANSKPPKEAATKDESNLFLAAGRVATQVYPDHMMNKPFLPGGTMAEFRGDNGEYREFLVHLADGKKAAFLLQDYKKVLQNAADTADNSAYFGTDDGQPTYVFVRGPYLAGVVGLSQDQAKAVARQWSDKLS
jgi:hypothetical protein